MCLHDRAWEGIRVVIVNPTPTRAAEIEQTIISASPAQEMQIESFEKYEPAYKFCKEQKNVGLLVLPEKLDGTPFQKIFRELSSHFNVSGFPAFGVITYDDIPNSFSAIAVGKNSSLLSYRHFSEFTDPDNIHSLLEDIWREYTAAFENTVIPTALQHSIISVAEDLYGQGVCQFISRTIETLAANANITWVEEVAIKWSPFIKYAARTSPAFLKPHPLLNNLVTLAEPTPFIKDAATLTEMINDSTPIHQKILKVTFELTELLLKNQLNETLDIISSKPGDPYILRQLHKTKERIKLFGLESNPANKLRSGT